MGEILITSVSWRWTFLVNAPIGLGTIAAPLLAIAESRAAGPRAESTHRLAALGIGIFFLILALVEDQKLQ